MCAIIKNPLQRDGTSQEDRLLKALQPGYAKIDDRKIEEIIAFAVEYSKLINYYNTSNEKDGDWSCFYANDPCILLALLSTIDTDSIEAAFKDLEEKIRAQLAKEAAEKPDACEIDPLPGYYDDLINLIYSVAIRIQQSCSKLPNGHVFKEEIITFITNDLHLAIIDNKQQDALVKLIGYDKGSIAPVNDYAPFIVTQENSYCSCRKSWQLDAEGYDCIYPDNSFNIDSLKSLFYIFFTVLLHIKQRAGTYFEDCIEKNDSHQPHVTLFLAFIYLFRTLVDQMNTLTEVHLRYYYEKVLCLHRKSEVPDKVHVVFELAKNFETHLIEEGTWLNAAKDDTGKQRIYAMLEQVVVNRATVAQLKTVYINEPTGTVHAAPVANSKDGLGDTFAKDEQAHWAPLGNANSPLKEVGYAVASPMFFLEEGLRGAMVSYRLETTQQMPLASLPRREAFRLLYSSGKDWIEIEDAFVIADRILGSGAYPILQKLFNDNLDTIYEGIGKGFDLVKKLYEKLYPAATTTATSTAVAAPKAAAKAKAVKAKTADATALPDWQSAIKFVQDTDASTLADLLMDAVKPGAEAPKKGVKAAAAAADDEIDKVALMKEILKVRNDILAIKHAYVYSKDTTRNELDFFILANTTAPAFSARIADDKDTDIRSDWPVLKTLVKNTMEETGQYLGQYNAIKEWRLKGVDIKVAAYGLKKLVVQNDTAILDNSKEILPFSNRPYTGSGFYVGSYEAFQKKLDAVGVQMEWAGRPSSFQTHYANYITTGITDSSFQVNTEVLSGGIFQNMYKGNYQDVFGNRFLGKDTVMLGAIKEIESDDDQNGDGQTDTPTQPPAPGIKKLAAKAIISDKDVSVSDLQSNFELRAFARDPYMQPFSDYNVNVQRGFMRLSLTPQDFLHDEYPRALLKLVVGAKDPITDPTKIINEPYTPKLKNTTLFYISSESITFGAGQYNANIEQFFHSTPFGYKKINIDSAPTVNLLPQFTGVVMPVFTQGNFYIGLQNAEPEQKVNILFQVLDGSGDNRFAPPDIEWSYLVNNEWVAFKPVEITDHTRVDESSRKSLLTSGIISFTLPKGITSAGATILDKSLLWIRAAAHEEPVTTNDVILQQAIPRVAALPDLVAVIAQAGIAQFENHGNSLNHLAVPLPAHTITKFIDSRAAVKKLDQPFNSFGGRMPEGDAAFYLRVSERLRHKNRAITIWDYEHLVLAQFPELHKVKCLNHTSILESHELAPGFVTISVIPDLRNRNAANKLEPRVPIGTLESIRVFLQKRTNLFVASAVNANLNYLQVVNPVYEPVRVSCCVRFRSGLDPAYYKYVLNDDLKKYLSPWAYNANTEINFGAPVQKSAILNFIEKRSYVDVILGFKVEHFRNSLYTPEPDTDVDTIIPTTSVSVLTSYTLVRPGSEYEHSIEHVPYDADNPCPGCGIIVTAEKG
ncbi:MAG: hypothetical protein QM731_04735 [Chitinophagaceae bacterium]